MLSKVEIDILKHLEENNLTNSMESRTIHNIAKHMGLSYARVRDNVTHLRTLDLVNFGFKEKNANTIFINTNGIEKIKEI